MKIIKPEDYLKLGYKVVHLFIKQNPNLADLREDLCQVAALSIVKSTRSFQELGLVKFSTYAVFQVEHSILQYLRDVERRWSNVVGAHLEDLTYDGEENIGWEDVVSGVVVDIPRAIGQLSPDCKEFIDLLNSGLTRHEIRKELGISWNDYGVLKERSKEELVQYTYRSIV